MIRQQEAVLNRAINRALPALQRNDCMAAWRQVRNALGAYHTLAGALEMQAIAQHHVTRREGRAYARASLRWAAAPMKVILNAFVERCLGRTLPTNMLPANDFLNGLGALGAESAPHPNAIAKILAALEKCRDALDEPDCVEAFMRLRDVRSAICSLTGGMQVLKSIGMAPREGGDKTFNPLITRLEAMESEFINECVKGTKMGRGNGGSKTINGCCGLDSTPPDDWTEKKLSDLLPPLAIKQIERAHAKGTLTVNMLKDICHAHAPRLDAQGVDPTFLAYLLAQKLGVRL